MRCADCPVDPAGRCRSDRFPWFCDFAASGHPIRRAHVVNRSEMVDHESATLDGPAASFPSLGKQAGNLADAVGRFVAGGLERTTPEERARRLAICRGCEQFSADRCRLCGCRLGLKVSMATEHCPIDKW